MKMKPVDVKIIRYIDFGKESNNKDRKFKIGDIVRISKYIDILLQIIKKVKNTVAWTYVLMILIVKKLLELFMKKNCKRQVKENLEQKKDL